MIENAHPALASGTAEPSSLPSAWAQGVRQSNLLLDGFSVGQHKQLKGILKHRHGDGRRRGVSLCPPDPVKPAERVEVPAPDEVRDVESVVLSDKGFHVSALG